MQSFIKGTSVSATTLGLNYGSGTIIQVRHHVKMYPWRQNRNNSRSYLDKTATPYTDRHNINEFRQSIKGKKPWMQVIPKDKDNRFNNFKWNSNYKSDPKEAKETAESRLSRFQDSLRDRGSAREQKPYTPPDDVQETVLAIFKQSQLASQEGTSNSFETAEQILDIDLNQSRALKFILITKCIEKFQHDMPGSYLNDISSVRDVVEYFCTPIRGVNPYVALLRQEELLPPNLSLVPEPLRYNIENDTFFKGHTAYPGLVNKVPGIRGSKKYPILNQTEFQWPDI